MLPLSVRSSALTLSGLFEYNLFVANSWWFVPEISFEYKESYTNLNLGFKVLKQFGQVLAHEQEGTPHD